VREARKRRDISYAEPLAIYKYPHTSFERRQQSSKQAMLKEQDLAVSNTIIVWRERDSSMKISHPKGRE